MTRIIAHLFGLSRGRITAGFVVAAFLLAVSASGARGVEAASGLRVSAQGDCLRLRADAGFSGTVIGCIPDGSSLVGAGQQASADGLDWILVRWGEVIGWAASQYLIEESAPPAPAATTPVPPAPSVAATRVSTTLPLREPPAGGLTVGLVSFVTPRAVAAAQPFEVASLSVYDAATGRFMTYIPGSPVNTIGDDSLPAETVVFIRRRGDLPTTLPAPVPVTTMAGTPSALATPIPGGTAVGIAGTGDLAAFVSAQGFAVESVSVWDTASQRWLSHIVGAPEFANTLRTGLLNADSVVFAKRSVTAVTPAAGAPVASSGLNTVSYGPAAISFYYCTPGARNGSAGDGGGFCGYMANGERVHAGAASCAASYMGQRFLIAGDPLNRIYTCKDTGGAVTAGHRDIWFADSDEGGDWWRIVGTTAEIRVIVP
ncbi:MAG: hypothetical protein C4558_01250 [Dehalococcoidia bacterium]|nr:MAG: hypothetical protein C4558_01250 [Dehalococcoidia bacterium]